MSQEFKIGLNTIVMLVGPSMSGKSRFAAQLTNELKHIDSNFRISTISSDAIRSQLFGSPLNKYEHNSNIMTNMAFDHLFSTLEKSLSHPAQQDFVIVDSTGLHQSFRDKIKDIAKSHAYRLAVVVFDYPNQSYYENIDPTNQYTQYDISQIIDKHVKVFKNEVLPKVKLKSFEYNLKVKEKANNFFDNISINIEDYALWKKTQLTFSDEKPYVFVGDIHEDLDALKRLLVKIPKESQIVLLGDYLDKGKNTVATVEFVHRLFKAGAQVVIGNHESFVYKRLKKMISPISPEVEASFFDSLGVLEKNPETQKMFFEIFENSLPFAYLKNHKISIYATHAPCRNIYLGKMSNAAHREQRNMSFGSHGVEPMQKALKFMDDENQFGAFHVFGHVAHNMPKIQHGNKFWLDSGSIYGNLLSSLVVYPNGKTELIQVPGTPKSTTDLFYFETHSPSPNVENISNDTNKFTETDSVLKKNTNLVQKFNEDTNQDTTSLVSHLSEKYKLEKKEINSLKAFAKNKASFIAGTISPTSSLSKGDLSLEPLSTGLHYYKNKNISKLSLQTKFMGSRLQIYLFDNISDSFVITRNGYETNSDNNELSHIIQSWWKLTKEKYQWKNSIILDGELLPWNFFGKDLIQSEFEPYHISLQNELNILENDTFFQKLEFPKKIDVSFEKRHLNIFKEQLHLFAEDSPISFKLFNVLKLDDKVFPFLSNDVIDSFFTLDEFPRLTIDLNDNYAFEKAEEFFNFVTTILQHEGIIIKPIVSYEELINEKIAPALKVRNENYLHLIYGHDFMNHYQQLCVNKKINHKLDSSVLQFKLGYKMLTTQDLHERLDIFCRIQSNNKSNIDLTL